MDKEQREAIVTNCWLLERTPLSGSRFTNTIKTFIEVLSGEKKITRDTNDQDVVAVIQLGLISLGYVTTMGGGALVDGDFGPGTNRGLAMFKIDWMNKEFWNNDPVDLASSSLLEVRRKMNPEELDAAAAEALFTALEWQIDYEPILGAPHEHIRVMDEIAEGRAIPCDGSSMQRLVSAAKMVSESILEDTGGKAKFDPAFLLALVYKETHGIPRPRFEHHYYAARRPWVETDPRRAREESTSWGIGQIMGSNAKDLGVPIPALHCSPPPEQFDLICRYLLRSKAGPIFTGRSFLLQQKDMRVIARYYNGPGFAQNRYDVQLWRWYQEYKEILS